MIAFRGILFSMRLFMALLAASPVDASLYSDSYVFSSFLQGSQVFHLFIELFYQFIVGHRWFFSLIFLPTRDS